MKHITAILSMLHETAGHGSSAERLFRGQPVLQWTINRLERAEKLDAVAVLCWDDQLPRVAAIAEEAHVYVLAKGPRQPIPALDGVTAARKFADGWRGGLLGTCEFDRGFFAPWVEELRLKLESDAVLLIDPAAALVDAGLIDGLIARAGENPDAEIVFSPAAPGLSGVLLTAQLLNRLAAAKTHPGRLLSYLPEAPIVDPLSSPNCAPVPVAVARTLHRFTLDSDRQTARIARATVSLNGQLISSPAEQLIETLNAIDAVDALPREVVLEINTQRATRPIYAAAGHLTIERPPMTLALADSIFKDLAAADDMRLTLAGVGDPLLSPDFFKIVESAKAHGIHAIGIETDLVGVSREVVTQLAEAPIDVVSLFLPAMTPGTYEQMMGYAGWNEVITNIRLFLERRAANSRGVPLLAPTFVKCQQNLAEMEAWYDQWLRAMASAVILGPADFGGLIPDHAVADMSPPRRRACARLNSRLTILSDGRVVSCEQDVLGKQTLGQIGSGTLSEIWQRQFAPLRADHAAGKLAVYPVCCKCREWHR